MWMLADALWVPGCGDGVPPPPAACPGYVLQPPMGVSFLGYLAQALIGEQRKGLPRQLPLPWLLERVVSPSLLGDEALQPLQVLGREGQAVGSDAEGTGGRVAVVQ